MSKKGPAGEAVPGRGYLFLASLLVFVFDQAAKLFVRGGLNTGSEVRLLGDFLVLTHVQNTGAGFSLLQGQNSLLILISAVVLVLMVSYFKKAGKNEAIALAVVSGGVAGNLFDRLVFGAVTDFIKVSIWPVFNIADIAITAGAAFLLISINRNILSKNTGQGDGRRKGSGPAG